MWMNGTQGAINFISGSNPMFCSMGTLNIFLHHWYILTDILASSHVLLAYDDQPEDEALLLPMVLAR